MAGRRKKGGSVLYSYDEERRYAGRAFASVILAMMSLLLLALLTGLSILFAGNSPAWLGALGAAAFIIAFIGMLEGFMSFRDECRSYALSKFGTAISAGMVAIWFLVFCFGLAR